MNKKGAGMERFEAKVDKALVEYDEFKDTIYPLLEASMGQIVSVRYAQMPPKSSVMTSYVPLVEKAIKSEKIDQPEMKELLKAVKAMTLFGFGVELGIIARKATNNKIEQVQIEDCINSGIEDDYSKEKYVNDDEAYVDLDTLKSYAKQIPTGPYKRRYEEKLLSLEKFYKKYY